MKQIPDIWLEWGKQIGWLLIAFFGIRILLWLLFRLLGRLYKKSEHPLFNLIEKYFRQPLIIGLPIVVALFLLPELRIGALLPESIHLVARIVFYLFLAWLLIQFVHLLSVALQRQLVIDDQQQFKDRKIITQVLYIKRVAIFTTFVLTASLILLQFDGVRELGATMLTSAGVAGIIIGFAAQKSIANLLAGFQLAFTQPIRINDFVIIHGEYGTVEEITLTYVVVRTWDRRRIVVPLNHFNDQHFQNWSRESTDLLASVYLYLDYRTPVQQLREYFLAIIQQEPLWDGQVRNMVVTDAREHTIEVRALMGARTPPQAWDLRCAVREKLIDYIRREYPEYLPRTRVVFPGAENGQRVSQPSSERESTH